MLKQQFLGAFLLSILLPFVAYSQTPYTITMLNVGEGESILIESHFTNETLLIDTGTLAAAKKILRTLKEKNINKLSKVLITHPHPDHSGGLFGISSVMEIDNFYDNGENLMPMSKENELYRQYSKLVRERKNYQVLNSGMRLAVDKLKLKVLMPEKQRIGDLNSDSLVMLLKYKKFKMLLMADANLATENMLTKMYCSKLNVNILKAGHHGAEDTASEEFLKCTRPEYVLLSYEKNLLPLIPHPKTIEIYKKAAKKIYQTAIDGDIVITLDQSGNYQIK